MDLNRFTDADWQPVRARLQKHEGGFDEAQFAIWLAFPETETRLQQAYGDSWTLEQALTLATGGENKDHKPKRPRQRKAPAVEAPPPAPRPGSTEESLQELENRVEARIVLYHGYFEDRSPNDEAAIRDLATTEIMLEVMNRRRLVEALAPVTEASSERISKLVADIAKLSDQHNKLQKLLGIDRLTRDREKEQKSDVEQVLEMIKDAAEWVEAECVPVVHCNRVLAHIYPDFREFPFEFKIICPKCEQVVVVRHAPSDEDRRAIQPEWVEQEEKEFAAVETLVEGNGHAQEVPF